MRYRYVLMTNPDPNDPNGYCRHRLDRFCRTCRKLRLEDCPHDDEVGCWEEDRIKWKSGPKILPFDGKRLPQRKRKPTPTGNKEIPALLPPVSDFPCFINHSFTFELKKLKRTSWVEGLRNSPQDSRKRIRVLSLL